MDTPIIMRVSDLEGAIQDYKFGLYSDSEFVKVLRTVIAKLEGELNRVYQGLNIRIPSSHCTKCDNVVLGEYDGLCAECAN